MFGGEFSYSLSQEAGSAVSPFQYGGYRAETLEFVIV